MSYREVISESWSSRILGSIKSVAFGFLLAGGSLPLLWCNEGRAVRTARGLEEGRGAVIAVGSDSVDPANEGRLVHLSGHADTGERLRDGDFGVSATAIQLARTTEMYQWKETEKSERRQKLGGSSETVRTYTYTPVWSKDEIDSDLFHDEMTTAKNPGPLPFPSTTFYAENVSLGAFRCPGLSSSRWASASRCRCTRDPLPRRRPRRSCASPARASIAARTPRTRRSATCVSPTAWSGRSW